MLGAEEAEDLDQVGHRKVTEGLGEVLGVRVLDDRPVPDVVDALDDVLGGLAHPLVRLHGVHRNTTGPRPDRLLGAASGPRGRAMDR